MSITYFGENKLFVIDTKNTTYAFDILHGSFLRHLYYGKTKTPPFDVKEYGAPCTPYRNMENGSYRPMLHMHEFSLFDGGDFRGASLNITGGNGTPVTEMVYEGYRIFNGRESLGILPSARADGETETLEIKLCSRSNGCVLYLYYTVFADTDVISRYLRLENCGEGRARIEKCMPLLLDLDRSDLDAINLHGAANKECQYQRSRLIHGIHSTLSRRGTSSHQHNPFLALCSHNATEERGDAYGFNLVYSGCFLNEVEVDEFNRTRVTMGLGGDYFSYLLEEGESFTSPETVMTYSRSGLGGMTRNMHAFIRRYILPPEAMKHHPVVLNTWEACYFRIDGEKLLSFADEAKKVGIDMLVVDDGWFGARNNDRAGLGDWYENREKFPRGLKAFAADVRARGLGFGIWIEPEMVNPDSDLYRAHPEWCLKAKDAPFLYSRSQMVLDMSDDAVVEYLKESFEKVFGDAEIDYFKWDMNRYLCAVGSDTLPVERQGEVRFRYMLGVYKLLGWFRERFPKAVIETCSGGGGRYDLGMMSYGFQIWTSDNTDPYARTEIQYGALTAYPAATMSCHVSDPKGSLSSLDFRYKVAVGGMLGYELNILKMSDEVKSAIAKHVEEYRSFEHIIRTGDYYRLVPPVKNRYTAYYYVMPDKSELLLSVIETADGKGGRTKKLKLGAVDGGAEYVDVYTGDRYKGSELKKGIAVDLDGTPDSAKLFYMKRV